jgi:pilus assembly protein CpaD
MPTAPFDARERAKRARLGVAAVALLAALSAGCTTTATSDVDVEDYDHRLRHPILLSNEPESLDMPVGMNGPALSPEIEGAIRDYVRDYQADGTGSITIQTPTASANEIAAASTGRAVHYALVRAGVPHRAIQVAPYYFGDHSKLAPLRLSYLRVKAVVPECGIWPERIANSRQNVPLDNFGCAAQKNLAAMVANPADLIRPQPMGPANGARRAHVIQIFAEVGNTGWTPEPERKLIGGGLVE